MSSFLHHTVCCVVYLAGTLHLVHGSTPTQDDFYQAIISNDLGEVEKLVKNRNIDINGKDQYGNTGLMHAAANGHDQIVILLLEQEGIEVNAQNIYGSTALIWASMLGRTKVVAVLLQDSRTNLELKYKNSLTAAIYAQLRGHHQIARMINEEQQSRKAKK